MHTYVWRYKDIQRLADTERTRWKPNKTGSLHKLTKRQRQQSQRVELSQVKGVGMGVWEQQQ